ncbi:class I SAM-dependent methyltransferase [Sphingobium boeckii]|uniref:Putative methyltransferase n=1 Tax=Sphingobium boeckii TaxID=1082345 RepID=A0A7W9AGY2_9SPHN|nr:methyltransferase domain-containing protein [Sphingobium boeckii]MBB5685510.1 putative methyltransferase [Sphingobium boeckii]
MRHPLLLSAALIFASAPALAQHEGHMMPADTAALKTAIAAPTRTPANTPRDQYRHPAETLAFFGVKPGAVVVEALPGGGWYTEILAPYLAKSGTLYLAQSEGKGRDRLTAKFAADTATYGKVKFSEFPMKGTAIPDGSADVVLTFRNVHNLIMDKDTTVPDQAFAGFFRALKPGGVLGVVDHRLPEDRDIALEKSSGYLKRSTIVALAEKAGFKLAGETEINANPKDTADWAKGVWTLPPTLANGDVDKAKYQAIGESDRMTLKFVKPK